MKTIPSTGFVIPSLDDMCFVHVFVFFPVSNFQSVGVRPHVFYFIRGATPTACQVATIPLRTPEVSRCGNSPVAKSPKKGRGSPGSDSSLVRGLAISGGGSHILLMPTSCSSSSSFQFDPATNRQRKGQVELASMSCLSRPRVALHDFCSFSIETKPVMTIVQHRESPFSVPDCNISNDKCL